MNREGKGVAVMAYTISDIAELAWYHLVLAESDDVRAEDNLAQLVHELQGMATRITFGTIPSP
jgi:hypothetical protein